MKLLDYCQSDVDAMARLLPVMWPRIDALRASIRGRYMAAVARMEWAGVPIDVAALAKVQTHWEAIQDRLIERIDKDFGVYEGRTFKANRFESWLAAKGIRWPRLESGSLALDKNTFREMAKSHPMVAPLRELRTSLSQLRLNELAVGSDGRNRCLLSPFGSRTGRNQPSNAKFVFGPAVWLRGLIRPEPGMGIAYIDFEQQEFAIGGALSGDPTMMAAYKTSEDWRCGKPCPNWWEDLPMVEDFFQNLERFRLPNSQAETRKERLANGERTFSKPPRVKGEFLKGPIPLAWLSTASMYNRGLLGNVESEASSG